MSGVDHRVPAAGAGDVHVADVEFVAGVHPRPRAAELGRGLRVRVQGRAGVRLDEGGQSLLVDVVGVLMGHQDRVQSGDALEAVGEVARIEEDGGTVQLDEDAAVAEVSQSHEFEYAPARMARPVRPMRTAGR